ncbi:TonB family protein, partial [Pseudomonas aeruginosa]|nr:TonB family protein [Pseudomonas aeruginosa]
GHQVSEKQVALLASVVALVLAAVSAIALVVAFAAQDAATKSVEELQALKTRADGQDRQIAQLTTNLIALGPILEIATGATQGKEESVAESGAVLSVGAPAEDNASAGSAAAAPKESPTVEAPKPDLQPNEKATAPVDDQSKSPTPAPAAKAQDAPKAVAQENLDEILARRIMSNWQKPESAKKGMSVDIVIKMARDGTVNEATVVKSSGDKAFDTSATDAILGVKSLPEMSQVSDKIYEELYKERRVSFAPLAG